MKTENHILITGATGDIGSQIARFFVRHKTPVSVLVREGAESLEKAHRILGKEDVKVVQTSMWSPNAIRALSQDHATIIHCMGVLKNKIKPDHENQIEAWLINSIYTGFLARYASASTLIVFSTNSVYELPLELQKPLADVYTAFRELIEACDDKDPEDILSFVTERLNEFQKQHSIPLKHTYAASKYVGELLVQEYAKRSVVGRLTNIFGPGYSLKRTIPKIIYNRLKGDQIEVKSTVRNYIYVADVGRIVAHFIENPPSKPILCNFDTKKYISIKELIKRIHFYTPTGYGTVVVHDAETNSYTPLLQKDSVPFIDAYYPKPFVPFEEALRKTIYHVQEKIVRTMENNKEVDFFVHHNEELVQSMFGSSSAQVLLLKNKETNKVFIRKIAMRRGVEGNGYPKLRSEHDFLIRVRRDHPKLSALYPAVIHSRNYGDAFALDYEYIEGGINAYKTLTTGLLTPDSFMDRFKRLFSQAIENGYLERTVKVTKSDALREGQNFYLHRAEYRLKGLEQNRYAVDFMTAHGFSFGKILNQKTISINGTTYLNTRTIIRELDKKRDLLEKLGVEKNHFCVHGDLTFLNMLYDKAKDAFTFIDPRGHYGLWDSYYDMGKLLFTLQGFGNIVESSYTMEQDVSGNFSITLSDLQSSQSPVPQVEKKLLSYFETDSTVAKLIEGDPYWKQKVKLAAATHFIADIPYRLFIDKSPKNAFVCYLLGTMRLNDFYTEISQI
jgi:nucleoside-diphosphate-sugar epimerase